MPWIRYIVQSVIIDGLALSTSIGQGQELLTIEVRRNTILLVYCKRKRFISLQTSSAFYDFLPLDRPNIILYLNS